jgi:6-phosphogluconolactonase
VSSAQTEIIRLESVEHVSQVAAEEFLNQSTGGTKQHGIFRVALSGGSTPKKLYAKLAHESKYREGVPWSTIHFFWGDERTVPQDHPDSNFRMASEGMLNHVNVQESQIHRIHAEEPNVDLAASEYEKEISNHFNVAPTDVPKFDLILLGLGPDAHTASLFPGTKALLEGERLVVGNYVQKLNAQRITMTFPLINHASCVIFLVCGEDKAEALKAVLEGPRNPELYPAQMVQPEGRLVWLIDHAAGRLLTK